MKRKVRPGPRSRVRRTRPNRKSSGVAGAFLLCMEYVRRYAADALVFTPLRSRLFADRAFIRTMEIQPPGAEPATSGFFLRRPINTEERRAALLVGRILAVTGPADFFSNNRREPPMLTATLMFIPGIRWRKDAYAARSKMPRPLSGPPVFLCPLLG